MLMTTSLAIISQAQIVRITVNENQQFTATLANNEAATQFAALLPMVVTMNELNGNEKYAYLSQTLTPSSYKPGTIQTGDLMLWGNNCLVLFYKTFASSYSYTRLGKITDSSRLAEAVGTGNVTIKFELATDMLIGDVDGNGIISIDDVTMLIKKILGTTPDGFQEEMADVNDDGSLTISDVTTLIELILNNQ